MSDCSTRAWTAPKWTDQVWHAPSGREIHVGYDEECHEVEIVFGDGTRRYLHYAGPPPELLLVDGTAYEAADDGLA